MSNISLVSDEQTARTARHCAQQRAEHLAVLGVRKVLELCVGPSLRELEMAYAAVGIEVVGNDIDQRWRAYYPKGKWLIGDAKTIPTKGFDAVVVAPPLSRGCSGRREDSLCLEQVVPSYYDFLNLECQITVFVLPGRTLALRTDRSQLHRFLSHLRGDAEVIPLVDKVTKYIDVYYRKTSYALETVAG